MSIGADVEEVIAQKDTSSCKDCCSSKHVSQGVLNIEKIQAKALLF